MKNFNKKLIGKNCFSRVVKLLMVMKLTAILIMVSTFGLLASETYAQSKRLTLKMENAKVEEVLANIQKQSEFYFFVYSEKVIDADRRVTVNLEEQNIETVLQTVFAGTDVAYLINDRLIVLTTPEVLGKVSPAVAQQQPAVSGKVTDESGQPLPGVTIVIKGTTQGTVTNADGEYSISSLPENATLQFSFVGMRSQEVVVGSQTSIDVRMEVEAIGIEEVVAVGYGTMKKSDLTGSLSSVRSDQLEKQGAKINILQALQGITPGLNIQQSSSNAAQSSYNILVRGKNSIKASNSPLIILDGVTYGGGLNEISQFDIESIEVLKDASAEAIYGSRAANGIILITTKRGKTGKPAITYNGTYGIQQVAYAPPILNAEEWWDFAMERVGIDVISNFPTLIKNHEEGVATDWLDLALRTGQEQNHTVNLNGGSDFFNYFVSGTYTNVKGIAKGDDFKQLVVRSNLSVNVTDWLTFGTNSQFTNRDNSGLTAGWNDTYKMNPLLKPFEDDGRTYEIFPWPEEPIYQNPLLNLYVNDEQYSQHLFSTNYIEINFPFIEGLSYKLNTGYRSNNSSTGRFYGQNTLVGLRNQGQAYTVDGNSKYKMLENIFIFKRDFNKHHHTWALRST